MIRHIDEIAHPVLRDELLRLARLDRNWVIWDQSPDGAFFCRSKITTWLSRSWQKGVDAASMMALSAWLVDGPKIFRVTPEQCAALEQVEVRLDVSEYAQPFPALLVDLPQGLYAPFTCVLCHHEHGRFVSVAFTPDHGDDIITTVTITGRPMEVALNTHDQSAAALGPIVSRVIRVGVNACLALTHFGCHAQYLYPKSVEDDRRILIKKAGTDAAKRATDRISLALQQVAFDREVVLHREARPKGEPGEPTGRSVACHWRRGHWHRVPCGTGKLERKLKLYPPTLVRADLLVGDPAGATTIYKTGG